MRWDDGALRELEPDGSLQIMYGLDGRHALPEEVLPHLEGYMGSRPVRVGNAAFDHLQLDIYGELMDSVYLYDKYGSPIGYDAWTNVVRLIDWVCANWRRPDEGIWEVRGGRQEFLYSRVMCWVAIDRAIRLATKRSFPAPLARWHETRDTIYQRRLHPLLGPDAARVHPARRRHHARRRGAADAARPLRVPDRPAVDLDAARDRARAGERLAGLSLSPRAADSPTGSRARKAPSRCAPSGTSSASPAWATSHKARFFFEKMLGYANHLGLYGEELGPAGAAPRQLPAGVHAPGAHQRRLRSRPPALGRRPRRIAKPGVPISESAGARALRPPTAPARRAPCCRFSASSTSSC